MPSAAREIIRLRLDLFHIIAAMYIPVDTYRSTVLRRSTLASIGADDLCRLLKIISVCRQLCGQDLLT